jgi:hypothetical protein
VLKSILKKRSLIEGIAINAMLFFVSLRAMESNQRIKAIRQPHKKLTPRKVTAVDCGLFPGLVPHDVVENCIKPEFSFCDMGRIKQVSQTCNSYWNLLCPLPYGCASHCSFFACRHLVTHFDNCSKALAYYASCNNENMFRHLYYHHQKTRNLNVGRMLNVEQINLKDCMNVYRGDVFAEDDKVRIRSGKLALALRAGDKTAVQILLLHKNFGIDQATGFYETLLKAACTYGDIEVLLKVIGGVEHINKVDCFGYAAIHYAFVSQNNNHLFYQLIECGADINLRDRYGKTVLFEAVRPQATIDHLHQVLKCKPAINIVCGHGCTVAHEAIIAYENHDDYDIQKIDLLLKAGIDVRIPDRNGCTFLHYASRISDFGKHKAMKALLKKHKEMIKNSKKKKKAKNVAKPD